MEPPQTTAQSARDAAPGANRSSAIGETRDNPSATPRHQPPPPTAARSPLVIVVGSGESPGSLGNPRLIPLGATLHIGRRTTVARESEPVAELVLPDRTASARHACIRWSPAEPEPFVVEDKASRNGTYVDGKRIQGKAALRDGTVLFIGTHVLVFRLVTPTERAAIQADAGSPLGPLPTTSPALALAAAKLRSLAPSGAAILLMGEPGVGKEVFARGIHAASGRSGRFVAVNCAGIPADLLERGLYGQEKGAHSAARGRKIGSVEMAAGGTLFLDEIGEMSMAPQSKLLQLVEDGRYTPVGSKRVIDAKVRIIAATSRAATGGAPIRDALLGRPAAVSLTLPPLRERVEDIGRLAHHFLRLAATNTHERRRTPRFEPEAFEALALHDWPLNVRELAKTITEALILSGGAPIGMEHLPVSITGSVRRGAQSSDEPGEPSPSDTVDRG